MGYVRALATVLLSTADPGRADRACSFSQECGRPRDGAGRKRAALKETDGGRTKPDELSSPQPTTVSNNRRRRSLIPTRDAP
jgi:hypothetical protein